MAKRVIRPAFSFKLSYPDGCRSEIHSRKDVEFTPQGWVDAVREYLAQMSKSIDSYDAELLRSQGKDT